MKKTIQQQTETTVHTCDYCGKELQFSPWVCLSCGAECCSDCNHKMHYVDRRRSVCVEGRGIGHSFEPLQFCCACIGEGKDPLIKAIFKLKEMDADILKKNDDYREADSKLSRKISAELQRRYRRFE